MTTNLLSQQDGIVPDTLLKSNQSWFLHITDQSVNDFYCSSEEEDEDYDIFDDSEYNEAICACGKKLSAGWNCNQCRMNCSTCQRALLPEEECSRCTR